MKEKPILFSGPMVRAILEDRKTQTRRVVKPQSTDWESVNVTFSNTLGRQIAPGANEVMFRRPDAGAIVIRCPYGQPGDRLWVKETFSRLHPGMLQHLDPEADSPDWSTVYRADGEPPNWSDYGANWKPSIFMPRWASRITLEITGIRVERLREISADDAESEGVGMGVNDQSGGPVARYAALWDSLNAKTHPWASNPWVWVLEFRQLKGTR